MKAAASSDLFAAIALTIVIASGTQQVIATGVIGQLTNLFADDAVNAEAIANMNNLTAAANPVNLETVGEASDLYTDEPSIVTARANNIFADTTSAVAIGASALNMLDNQILCGYQGWFAFPGDGAPVNRWRHWFVPAAANMAAPLAGDLMVDVYPAIDEYDDADLHTSGIKMRDGSYAKFYSSARPNVVLKHFQWMQTYGISGVFLIRFMQDINIPANREWKIMVLRNVRSAAESTGRIFALSYNIAGTTDAILEDLKADWIKLVDEETITQSSQYVRQNGLPVLRIYGIGFTAVNVSDTTMMADFIKWFQTDAPEKYRVFLVGGVPSRWRDLTGDSRNDRAWKDIYDSLDGIHPWHVGRWRTISSFNTYHTDIISKDSAYCASKGILYIPTMWPGFSWHNLNDEQEPINDIPRLGGTFMWRQAYKYAADSNINTVWLAQFDECDEGTAIYKLTAKTSDLPVDGNWLALDADGYSVRSDHYLRLAGEAQKMLDGSKPLQATMPTPSPTRLPTQKPMTKVPTTKPSTKTPTFKPTPTYSPTSKPTSSKPTNASTSKPSTKSPTSQPTVTKSPSLKPTNASTSKPSTKSPTGQPTVTKSPSSKPTNASTSKPSTKSPTGQPTVTKSPSLKPTTAKPSAPATLKPTTHSPTLKPTTKLPTSKPTKPTTKRTSLTTSARPRPSG